MTKAMIPKRISVESDKVKIVIHSLNRSLGPSFPLFAMSFEPTMPVSSNSIFRTFELLARFSGVAGGLTFILLLLVICAD